MNSPLRRLAVATMVLFLALLLGANWVQAVRADDLRNRQGNARVLDREYEQQRGPILVGDKAVARSVQTQDRLKYLRQYPGGAEYAPVTGFYSLVYGRTGLESEENPALSGTDDRLFVRRLSDLITGRSPQGAAVVTTIDPAVQDAAWQGLQGKQGAAVALDPSTGAILALVSTPSYDPAPLASHQPAAIRSAYNRLAKAEGDPLVDRAISDRYPPGSLFKVVTSAAALSSGDYQPSTEIPAPATYQLPQSSRQLRNFGGESCSPTGRQTLADALRISCNTAFAGLGVTLGADTLAHQAKAFGIGQDDLHVPMPVAQSVFPSDANAPQTAQSAIGQFNVALTPLQAAMIAAGVANHGSVMAPYLVKEIQAPDLSVIDKADPHELTRAVSPAVADQLTSMMIGVVADGTGTAAQIPGVTVAGKTGTAQHGEGQPPHAWFIAFAPAQQPRIAVAVLVLDGGSSGSEATGGREAAPIAKAMMQAALQGAGG